MQKRLNRKSAEELMIRLGFVHNPGHHCFSAYFMQFFFRIEEDRKGKKFVPKSEFRTLVKNEKQRLGLN